MVRLDLDLHDIWTVSGELVNISLHLELRLWVGPGVVFVEGLTTTGLNQTNANHLF